MAEVLERLRVRYQCSRCLRSWSKRKSAEAHVARCVHEPENRACVTCKYDSLEDDGFACGLNAKPEGETCIRHCPLWEPHVFLKTEPAP